MRGNNLDALRKEVSGFSAHARRSAAKLSIASMRL